MNTYITEIENWIKNNVAVASGIGVVILAGLYFLFKGKKRVVRHHRTLYPAPRRRLPRSVGRRRMKGAKRPWQVKGSLAARRHMAQIRKRR